MEPKGSDTHDNFFTSLNQLITSLEPAIKQAGSVAAAEDVLTHLESTDENFHRYDFVRQLRSRIETVLGPVIDKELERVAVDGEGTTLVPLITDEVLASQEYVGLQQSILADTKDAVNALIQNFAQNPGHRLSDQEFGDHRYRSQSMKIIHGDALESSDEESMSSSMGKLRYTFMSHEKFIKIAEDLDPGKPLSVRFETLSLLYQVPQSDVIASTSWAGIRNGLLAALADEDEQLAERSLKFHARMFMTSSAQVTREIYTCLAEHLCLHFNDGTHKMIPIENGLDISSRNNQRLLKRFRLLNEFQLEVPAYWIRYPQRFLEEVLEGTFKLLSMSTMPPLGSSCLQFMSPLHFLALLDPKATWFKKWMHGSYSRTEVVKQLKQHPSLLADTVRQCLDFAGTYKTLVPLGDTMDFGDERRNYDEGLFYTGHDLEYVYVVHSLGLLGRLLLYQDGRALFPVELPDREESVTVHAVLVALIRVMCTPLVEPNPNVPVVAQFHPGYIVCEVLGEIASNSEASKECLCKDVITTNLLSPVQSWLDGLIGLDGGDLAAAECTLLLVADVLAILAVSETGRQQLLYGETQERWQRSRFSPAHTIAQFAKKALSGQLPGGSVPRAAISGFVFVCRQLYNTCEGLIVLNPYGLHRCVANAWSEAHEANTLPESEDVPALDETPPESTHYQELFAWESSLIDNLLNFAGTPKGLLLLQQTGKMNECVAFMHERYTKKLQVSRCEKFGYGAMVSQIATTAPGMVALENLGFLKNLVHDVWMVFEGRHTSELDPPRIKHVDGIDSRVYSKCLNNLLSVLSAFPAVYEILADADRPFTSGSDVEDTITSEAFTSPPTSILELIDLFIMTDSDAKINSLFTFETSHHFGLRVLSVLCSCLDTFLFLECRYRFQELLLEWQLKNRLDNGKDYILDMCSLERNYILVRTYFWGGPAERICAGRRLTEDVDNPYPWPLFSTYPPPKVYLPQDQRPEEAASGQGDDLLEVLQRANTTASESVTWLEECREVFCATVTATNMRGKRKVFKLLLEKVCLALINVPDESIFPLIEYSVSETSLKNIELSEIESLGIKLVVRYGLQLKCLESNTDGMEDLTHLLKHTKFFLQGQQKSTKSSLRTLRGDYVGHDWFVSTIFLMMLGDPDEAWEFLFKFSSLVSSGYLWVRRLHASVHLPQSLTVSGIPPLYSCTCHNVDLILQAEVPLVYSAFRMSGFTPSQICQHWLRQCFWNYLNWDEICLYIVTCLVMGLDYQVYFCIAIYRHLQQDILRHTQQQDLLIYLKEEPIRDFKVGEHLNFMQEMEARHRQTILPDLQNITKP